MVMGGLIIDTDRTTSAGLPLLSRIPVIGGLFGEQSVKKNRSELVLFVTPKVMDNESTAAASSTICAGGWSVWTAVPATPDWPMSPPTPSRSRAVLRARGRPCRVPPRAARICRSPVTRRVVCSAPHTCLLAAARRALQCRKARQSTSRRRGIALNHRSPRIFPSIARPSVAALRASSGRTGKLLGAGIDELRDDR